MKLWEDNFRMFLLTKGSLYILDSICMKYSLLYTLKLARYPEQESTRKLVSSHVIICQNVAPLSKGITKLTLCVGRNKTHVCISILLFLSLVPYLVSSCSFVFFFLASILYNLNIRKPYFKGKRDNWERLLFSLRLSPSPCVSFGFLACVNSLSFVLDLNSMGSRSLFCFP